MLETPTLAIEQSHKEIRKMGDGCLKMLDWLHELRQQEEPEKALSDRLKHREQMLDNVQDEIAEFMTKLLSGNIPHAVADEARRQLQLADEYESMSDYIANLEKFDRKLRRDGLRFNPEQRAELDQLNQLCRDYLVAVNEAMAVSNRTVQIKTAPMSKRIRDAIKQRRKKHLDEISQGSIPPCSDDCVYGMSECLLQSPRSHPRNRRRSLGTTLNHPLSESLFPCTHAVRFDSDVNHFFANTNPS